MKMGFQLISNDKYIYDVNENMSKRCVLLNNMEHYCKDDGENEPAAVPFSGEILLKIIDYCDHYKDKKIKALTVDSIIRDNNLVEITEWDEKFFENVETGKLKEMFNAANFLLNEELSLKIGKTFSQTRLPLNDKTLTWTEKVLKVIEIVGIPIDTLPQNTQEMVGKYNQK
jgi:Skp1 family, tetramerisation domain